MKVDTKNMINTLLQENQRIRVQSDLRLVDVSLNILFGESKE